MTSRQHQDWINRGKPDSGLALPLQLLANTLAAAGYTVYVYPNDAHLDAEPPEDHTYYSETGWPILSPKWWRHAIDIMPSHGGADLYALGQRIVADRNSGKANWIKYINVPTSASLGGALQHSWKPGHSVRTSSDVGHIHVSSITGCETLDNSYNPLTGIVLASTITTDPTTPAIAAQPTEDPVPFLALAASGQYYLSDGMRSVPVDSARIADLRTLRDEGLIVVGKNAKGQSTLEFPRTGWTPSFGPVDQAPATVDVKAFAAALAPLLPPGTTVDVPALAAALKPLLPTHVSLTGTVS